MQEGSQIMWFQFLCSLDINLEPEKNPKYIKSYKMLISLMTSLSSSEIHTKALTNSLA